MIGTRIGTTAVEQSAPAAAAPAGPLGPGFAGSAYRKDWGTDPRRVTIEVL